MLTQVLTNLLSNAAKFTEPGGHIRLCARVEDGQLVLRNMHIDPYEKATIVNHEPLRERRLLAHRREIKKLADATRERGTTLVPLAVYFKGPHVKVEIGVVRGKQDYDKRESIKKKEMDKEVRRAMSHRR